MHLDKQHPRPVYLQLKELLQNQIEQGVYLSHQQLPSERYLCQHHNLSRMTVRRALQQLIAEGLVYTRAGKGTFVNQNPKIHRRNVSVLPDSAKGAELVSSVSNGHYRQKLLIPLQSFDCVGVEQAINEALANHPLEMVAGQLFLETIRVFERKWHKGEVTLLAHNYAITTIRSQLIAMMNAATMPKTGPKVLLACAPGDLHEIGLLLLALNLRRRGFLVIYMGSNFCIEEFHQVIEQAQPKFVCLSAATDQSAKNLIELGYRYQDKLSTEKNHQQFEFGHKPLLTFGGVIFNQNPVLVSSMPGHYLGNTVNDAVTAIEDIISSVGN